MNKAFFILTNNLYIHTTDLLRERDWGSFTGVKVGRGAVIENSVVMPGAKIADGAVIKKAILGENAYVGKHARIGESPSESISYDTSLTGDITLIAGGARIKDASIIPAGMIVSDASAKKEGN